MNITTTATKRAGLTAALVAAAAILGGFAIADAAAMPGPTAPLTPSIPIPPPSPAEPRSGSHSSANMSESQMADIVRRVQAAAATP